MAGANVRHDAMQTGVELRCDDLASFNGNKAWLSFADSARAGFAATDGKEVVTLSEEEAAKFNAASGRFAAAHL